ncbi:MAG: hypothetical protein PHN69_08240, partial [Candidatus Pacebacteria bacterium]|nr:hypothetical protein [Candidatus Paceibacterota bacterium]
MTAQNMKYKFLFSLIFSLIIVFSGTSVFAWDNCFSFTPANPCYDSLPIGSLIPSSRITFSSSYPNLYIDVSSYGYYQNTRFAVYEYESSTPPFVVVPNLVNNSSYNSDILDVLLVAPYVSADKTYLFELWPKQYISSGDVPNDLLPEMKYFFFHKDSSDNLIYGPYTTAVNGSCGSANGGSFFQIPSADLCSSGTLDFGVV